MRNVTSAARHAAVPGLATTSAKLRTKVGEVKLRIPKLRTQTFETAIIERYRRRESSVEEALIEMYLAEADVQRVWAHAKRMGDSGLISTDREGRPHSAPVG
jgi:transposase-like protein